MTGMWLLYLSAAVLMLGLSAFFSGTETGIYCVSRLKLHSRYDRSERGAERLWRFLADEQSALSVTLIGTNISNYVVTAIVATFLAREMGLDTHRTEVYTTLLVTPVVFAFGEVVPKNLFRVAADRLMYPAALVLNLAHALFLPLVWILRLFIAQLENLGAGGTRFGRTAFAARGRMATLLREGLLHVGSDPDHFDLVERVLALSNTPVHSVMVPRNRVVSADVSLGLSGLRSLASDCRHTRVPVYEASLRRIIGLVVVHEALADSSWESLRPFLKPVIALNPQDSVASAILRMQKDRQTMGIVVDRAGLMLGLVTLKDLMEEIVGELAEW